MLCAGSRPQPCTAHTPRAAWCPWPPSEHHCSNIPLISHPVRSESESSLSPFSLGNDVMNTSLSWLETLSCTTFSFTLKSLHRILDFGHLWSGLKGGYNTNFSPVAFTGCPHSRSHPRQGDSHGLNEREQTASHLSSDSHQMSSRHSTEQPKSQTERQDQKGTSRARTISLHVCGKGGTGRFQPSGWAGGDFRCV